MLIGGVMNFQQLRIVREAVRCGFNLTEVANALFTSQPGVSKHIKDLEDELGVELFVRRSKRLLGLTEPGKELAEIAERILRDTQNIRRIADQFASRQQGCLRLACSQAIARYYLLDIMAAFRTCYPQVNLALVHADPGEVAEMLVSGEADIGLAADGLPLAQELKTYACFKWQLCVVVPPEHPLAGLPQLTLAALAEFPLVTYNESFAARARIENTFMAAGLNAEVALAAPDEELIKDAVVAGMGAGIMAQTAFAAQRDGALCVLPAEHLFPGGTTRLAVHRGVFLRDYVRDFIDLAAPGGQSDDAEPDFMI